ncbi:unnamed protein product, partial [Symbiodinium sp. KB8]
KTANGDKSLVIHEESEEGSFVESAASHVSAALESFDEAARSAACAERALHDFCYAGISRYFHLAVRFADACSDWVTLFVPRIACFERWDLGESSGAVSLHRHFQGSAHFAMLDLITIISAAGLQQERRLMSAITPRITPPSPPVSRWLDDTKAANGDRSLVINEESEEGSFVESAASQVSAALESFDEAVSQGMSALTDLLGLGSIFRELPVCATLRRLNNGLPRVQARSKIHQCPIAIHIEG